MWELRKLIHAIIIKVLQMTLTGSKSVHTVGFWGMRIHKARTPTGNTHNEFTNHWVNKTCAVRIVYIIFTFYLYTHSLTHGLSTTQLHYMVVLYDKHL